MPVIRFLERSDCLTKKFMKVFFKERKEALRNTEEKITVLMEASLLENDLIMELFKLKEKEILE